jgi:hypothetical protein
MISKKIELMYRSSKLNQERVNLLRNSSESNQTIGEFDSDQEKSKSIISYLPPMNLSNVGDILIYMLI